MSDKAENPISQEALDGISRLRALGLSDDEIRLILECLLEKRLFELGYLSRIAPPITDFTPYENRTLIKVEGKPLSEIVVEERG